MEHTMNRLTVNRENLARGFIPEIYATDRALELVSGGMPFRDAYKEVGLHLDELSNMDPGTVIAAKKHTGATGNLCLNKAQAQLETFEKTLEQKRNRIEQAFKKLLGSRPVLFRSLK